MNMSSIHFVLEQLLETRSSFLLACVFFDSPRRMSEEKASAKVKE